MIPIKIIFENKNKFLGKAFTPVSIYKDELANLLREYTSVTIAEDVKSTVDEKKYKVKEIQIPSWMDANFFIGEFEKIRILKYLALEGAKLSYLEFATIPRKLFDYLLKTEPMEQLAILKLWRMGHNGSLRSGFRKNIFMRLKLWVDDKNSVYPTPFSTRQRECVLEPFTCAEATQLMDKYKSIREEW